MTATEKRLGFALLLTAGIIITNVFMVVIGATGGFYDHLTGTAPQHTAQVTLKERINLPASGSRDSMPAESVGFLPGHAIKRG